MYCVSASSARVDGPLPAATGFEWPRISYERLGGELDERRFQESQVLAISYPGWNMWGYTGT